MPSQIPDKFDEFVENSTYTIVAEVYSSPDYEAVNFRSVGITGIANVTFGMKVNCKDKPGFLGVSEQEVMVSSSMVDEGWVVYGKPIDSKPANWTLIGNPHVLISGDYPALQWERYAVIVARWHNGIVHFKTIGARLGETTYPVVCLYDGERYKHNVAQTYRVSFFDLTPTVPEMTPEALVINVSDTQGFVDVLGVVMTKPFGLEELKSWMAESDKVTTFQPLTGTKK
jgi:hypothetical protein